MKPKVIAILTKPRCQDIVLSTTDEDFQLIDVTYQMHNSGKVKGTFMIAQQDIPGFIKFRKHMGYKTLQRTK